MIHLYNHSLDNVRKNKIREHENKQKSALTRFCLLLIFNLRLLLLVMHVVDVVLIKVLLIVYSQLLF